jgi:phage-related protein
MADQPQPYWPWCAQPGASRATTLAVDQVDYGDGYKHRSTRGLNPVRPQWDLAFPFTSLAELNERDQFLRDHAAAGFWITPPDASEPVYVTADQWSASIADRNVASGIVGQLTATLVQTFNPQPIVVAPDIPGSVAKAMAYVKAQAASRSAFVSTTLTPDDPTIDRHHAGAWTGTWTDPTDKHATLPYTPLLITGPLWFPIVPGQRIDFAGRVDVPFYSMDGWQGRRDMANPAPPPEFITDPSTVYANGGTNWGAYFVIGSCDGIKRFSAHVDANATWAATLPAAPNGSWEFQLVTYANQGDADADANRILIGNPWKQVERPGDVRDYYGGLYTPAPPQFTDVVLIGAGPSTITGTLQPFAASGGRTYQILVTNEVDVEYAWALHPVAASGAFVINRPQAFGGSIKLRLVEQQDGASVRVLGQVWAQETAALATAFPDLRIEYRSITSSVPPFPTAVYPANMVHTWSVPALPGDGSVARVSLVNTNTKRVYGEFTMPTGLMRSFVVPASDSGQNTASVYYDGFLDTCFLYDQAVALIAFLTAGEQQAAAKLLNALVSVQQSDGGFPFSSGQATLYDRSTEGFVRVGAVAWVCYALLLCDQPQFRAWFPARTNTMALACLDFIAAYQNAIGTINGGKGQYVDGVFDPSYVVPWWSTEHNIDAWWCFDLANQLYGDPAHRAIADTIKAQLLTNGVGWAGASGIFWQGGTVDAGPPVVNTPDGMHALDTHSWGAVLLERWGRVADAHYSLTRATRYYYVTDIASGLKGYTTFVPDDGYPASTVKTPWYEGSFGVVVAQRGDSVYQADALMAELVRAQRADGGFLYALQNDPVNDIHDWPCTIAPAWCVLAWSGPGTPVARVLWPLT